MKPGILGFHLPFGQQLQQGDDAVVQAGVGDAELFQHFVEGMDDAADVMRRVVQHCHSLLESLPRRFLSRFVGGMIDHDGFIHIMIQEIIADDVLVSAVRTMHGKRFQRPHRVLHLFISLRIHAVPYLKPAGFAALGTGNLFLMESRHNEPPCVSLCYDIYFAADTTPAAFQLFHSYYIFTKKACQFPAANSPIRAHLPQPRQRCFKSMHRHAPLLTAIKKYSMLYLNSLGKIDSRRPRSLLPDEKRPSSRTAQGRPHA